MGTNRKYWKGLDELNETPEFVASTKNEFPQELSVDQFLAEDKLKESSTGRRDFLKFLGFSVAAATLAACEAPVIKAVPYAVKPEDVTPGVANWYASTYYDGEAYSSILVKTREGRPIHIKGNKDHGFTRGATNPRIVGSVLSLYDSERLQNPKIDGADAGWSKADKEIIKGLKKTVKAGKKIVLLSNTVISPSTLSIIEQFKAEVGGVNPQATAVEGEGGVLNATPANTNIEHVQYDAVSYSGIRKANLESFGKDIIPDYDFSKAKTIVSVGADFFNSWVMPVQFMADYLLTRNPDNDWMSRHFQFESNMSMTGSNADVRSMIKPSEQGKVLALLHKKVTGSAVPGIKTEGLAEEVVKNIEQAAKELKASKGESIVVAGSNRKSIQVIVNSINSALKNYEGTINLNAPINLFKSEDDKMDQLVKDMNAGKVGALISWDTNPIYTYGNSASFKAGLAKVGLTVSMSKYADETASLFTYNCPDSHALETWNDFNPKGGHYAIAQPTIRPLHNTRPAAESLLVWAGMAEHAGKDSKTYYEFIRGLWDKWGYQMDNEGHDSFHTYWSEMVHNSCTSDKPKSASAIPFNGDLSKAGKAESKIKGGTWEIAFYQKAGIGTGIHANNPWLQELPDPVSKVTWDNYVTMAPSDMDAAGYSKKLGQEQAQNVVAVQVGENSIELPVYPQPGQAPGTIGIAYGYGRGEGGEAIGKSAYQQEGIYGEASKTMIGASAYKLISNNESEAFEASIADTGKTYILACTQTHATVMARNSIMKETTFNTYKNADPSAYNHRHTLHSGWNHDVELTEEFDLWDEHPVEHVGHRWAMTIDLNSCVGCGSCVIACSSENNVPVVGRDEVRRGREMHWLRIDRYYASDSEATVGTRNPDDFNEGGFGALKKPAENPKVAFMPMMCQQCNHAPCETVCPVAATTHSNEGLNQMAYNRCIGTRYCANNCPYKVRRFNWFNYPSYRKFTEVNPAQDDLGRMVLNPDVVVRTRGVMEKCSFCVQKIQSGKLVAKKENRPVKDGDAMTACADACPADAITFGDWNDTNSAVRKSSEEKRSYQALEEIGVKPNIWYKVKVRNEINAELDEIQTAHGHGGHDDHGDAHGDDHGHGHEETHETTNHH
ncbi:TAT-variant-translocated molybdopterin oxidoreductase [Crocinitomix algicola]|uniref:TAT-variant-translocated molybdopterin oxidoreductase n=1 Tax=Crocinitomix algicola TaxID=1740263 RepID=UPI00082AD45B|nr:TAT-variant-translocated molybdopterin oxidoreductase [Crocinitomix algicola]